MHPSCLSSDVFQHKNIQRNKVSTLWAEVWSIKLKYENFRYTHQKATNRAVSGELNLATVLICIVAVFLICHIPRVILNCTEFFLVDEMLNCPEGFSPPNWNLCLASLNHALLIINASINFIIYTSMGDSFNIALKQMIKRY